MTAEEAKKKSLEKNQERDERMYNTLIFQIQAAANNGKYNTSTEDLITDSVKKRLTELGYTVGSKHISW